MNKLPEELRHADSRYVWHPFTQMKEWAEEERIIVTEGKGCFVRDVRGMWYLDGVSSLWVNIHGHRKKEIDLGLKSQIDRIAHSTLLGACNEPSIALAERLASLTASSLGDRAPQRVFYSDNGSTAVEVALKMAFQYWLLKGIKGRDAFLSLDNAYHGDTLGAVSVGGIDVFHGAFGPLLFKTHRVPSPYCYRCPLGLREDDCGMGCLGKMEEILKTHGDGIAAVIIEPLVQAAGGMIVFPRGYVEGVRELCTRYNVLMIADEVATGFGRTGRMFACEHESVAPDIMCLSKGLTGGYMPLAATLATEEIYGAFLGGFGEMKTFFHGHSYTGNQLGCACALACLDVFENEGTIEQLKPKSQLLADWIGRIGRHPRVGNARGMGLMAGVELVRDKQSREPYAWEEKIGWKVAHAARDEGLLIRPLGGVVVIMPPLAIGIRNLQRMLDIVSRSIDKACGRT